MEIILERPTSYSKMTSMQECPRRYYWENVNPQPRTPEMIAASEKKFGFGHFLHERIEAGFRAINQDLTAQRLQCPLFSPRLNTQLFLNAANQGGIPKEYAKKWALMMGHFAGWLQRNQDFFSILFAFDNPVIEWPFALNEDWQFVGWSGDRTEKIPRLALRGFIDLHAIVRSHVNQQVKSPMTAFVWDWKSSVRRSIPFDPKTKKPSPQLALYALSMFRRYKDLELVTATYFNMRWADPEQAITFTREQAEQWGIAWVESIVNDVLERDPYNEYCWEPKENEYCWTCEYGGICPLMKRKRYEYAQKAAEKAELEASGQH